MAQIFFDIMSMLGSAFSDTPRVVLEELSQSLVISLAIGVIGIVVFFYYLVDSTPQISMEEKMPIKKLYVYPVESCLPAEMDKVYISRYGFEFDRQFFFVKNEETIVTTQDTTKLFNIQPRIEDSNLVLEYLGPGITNEEISTLTIPLNEKSIKSEDLKEILLEEPTFPSPSSSSSSSTTDPPKKSYVKVYIIKTADSWVSKVLGPNFALGKVSFGGIVPSIERPKISITIVNEESVKAVQNRVGAEKENLYDFATYFRPNIVVSSEKEFREDWWSAIDLVATRGWLAGKSVPLRIISPMYHNHQKMSVYLQSDVRRNRIIDALNTFRVCRDPQHRNEALFGVRCQFSLDPKMLSGAFIQVDDRVETKECVRSSCLSSRNLASLYGVS